LSNACSTCIREVTAFVSWSTLERSRWVCGAMKIATRGCWLWTRTIGSTLVGQGLDSLVFITRAFVGIMQEEGIS